MGRPSEFTQETADEICEWIASGKSLDSWVKQGKASWPKICRWLDANEEFRKNYARARELQADVIFDECLSIADTTVVGQKTTIEANGDVKVTEGDMLEHRKLQVDTRKWMAGKLQPKKYGDKVEQEHSGEIKVTFENADGSRG